MQSRLIIFFVLLTTAYSKIYAQKEEDVLAYIAAYKEMAMKEMNRTGVPAAIKLAQGIHETDAGKSELVLKSNNHFGIKCKTTWSGEKVYHDDDARGECFRRYEKPEASYMDHSDFLKNSPRYAFLFALDPTDYEGWAYGLKKAGYATNINYSKILIRLIRTYNLEDFTLIALGRMKESDRMLAVNSTLLPRAETIIMNEEPKPESVAAPVYPSGQFTINNTKVVFVNANTAWLSIAEQYAIPLSRLWDFNDIKKDDDIIKKAQLVYIQRKRKVGGFEFHTVLQGESLYDICQLEGIRYESLLELNFLNGSLQPAAGEKLYLQNIATRRPMLVNEQKNKISFAGNNSLEKLSAIKEPTNSITGSNSNTSNNIQATPLYTTHLVTTKETLYSIAKRYGVALEKLKEWNGLNDLDLKIGQSLIIYKSN